MSNDRFEQLKAQARAELQRTRRGIEDGDLSLEAARKRFDLAKEQVSNAERIVEANPSVGEDTATEVAVQRLKVDADELDLLRGEDEASRLKRDYEEARARFIEIFGEEP